MLGSTYSHPRGLVFVSTGGFYPKITGIVLLKSELLECCRAHGVAGGGGIPPAAGGGVALRCCSCCGSRERQNTGAWMQLRKKSPSELLEILTSPEDVMKWIPIGRVLARARFVTLSKSRQVGGHEPAQHFIQLSQPRVVLFCEGNPREEVLEVLVLI